MPDHIHTIPAPIITTGGLRVQWATISVAAAGTTTIVSGVSGQLIDILGIDYFCNGSVTITLRDGAGKMLMGSQSFTTTTGVIRDLRANPWFSGDSGEGFVFLTSGTAQISGGVWYIQG